MIVRGLGLVNYGPYSDTVVDFREGIIGIFGQGSTADNSNGAGKSTLVEAIGYAVFGRSERYKQLAAMRRRGADDNVVVGMPFQLQGTEREVTRTWSEGGSTLMLDDLKGSVPEIQAALIRELGLTYPTFLASSFFLQGQSDKFTAAGSAGRLQYLREILEQGFWDRCHKRAATEAKRADDTVRDVEVALSEMDRQIKDLRTEHSGFKAAASGRTIEKLQGQVDRITDKKTELDLQEYQAANAEDRVVELSNEDDGASARLRGAREDLERMVAERKQIGTGKVKMYAAVGALRATAQLDIEAQTKEMARCEHRMSIDKEFVHTVHGGVCPTCRQLVDETALGKLKTIARQAIRTWQVAYKELQREYQKQMKWVADLDDKREHNLLAQEVAKKRLGLGALTTRIEKGREGITELEERLDELASEVGIAQAQADSLDDVRNKRDDVLEQLYDAQRKLDAEKGRLTRYEAGQKQIAKLEADHKAGADTLTAALETSNRYGRLRQAYGKTGIPMSVVEAVVRGELRTNTNAVLQEILPQASVSFDLSSGDRDNLNVLVRFGNEVAPYETFSGGEREILNFAIRMALSRLLRNRATGAPIEFVVLDEVFGPLDEANKAKVEAMLLVLRQEFRQIFVISHRPINIPLDQVVTVTQVGPGRSEIRAD